MTDKPSQGSRYAAFCRRLIMAREAAGFSQEEAASRLGRSQSHVSRCESGEKRVDVMELLLFADLYGVDVVRFFD